MVEKTKKLPVIESMVLKTNSHLSARVMKPNENESVEIEELVNQNNLLSTLIMRTFLNYFTGLFFGEGEYKNWQITLFVLLLIGLFAILTII
jgi:hypothetical protein